MSVILAWANLWFRHTPQFYMYPLLHTMGLQARLSLNMIINYLYWGSGPCEIQYQANSFFPFGDLGVMIYSAAQCLMGIQYN